jgi:ribosomal protein L35
MRKKTASQQRHLQKCQPLDSSDAPRLRRMLGEGF